MNCEIENGAQQARRQVLAEIPRPIKPYCTSISPRTIPEDDIPSRKRTAQKPRPRGQCRAIKLGGKLGGVRAYAQFRRKDSRMQMLTEPTVGAKVQDPRLAPGRRSGWVPCNEE